MIKKRGQGGQSQQDQGQRGRAWRRWRAEVSLARVLAFIRLPHHNWRFYGRIYGYVQYDRRLSITETEHLRVRTAAEFERYLLWKARLRRDARKSCACQSCCNPRHSRYSSPSEQLTHQERIARQRAASFETMAEAGPAGAE